jgi:hypothetical protein
MLMTTQDTIGPDSLLLGHFLPTWTLLQERYLRAIDEPVGHHQASRGIKALITQTLEQCHCTWLLRNEHLHGTSPFQPHSYNHLDLLAQVTELYKAAPIMLMSDRDIFEIPLEDRRNQTKATLQSFYTFAKLIVDLSLRHAADWSTNFRHIDSYFPQQIPPDICAIICD